MGRLAGKVAVITGGASGQGAAEAEAFVAEGARVVVGDVQDGPGRELAERHGASMGFVHLDVSQEEDWESAVAFARERFGKLDVLVNNAGIASGGPLNRTSLAGYRRIVDVNQIGTFLGMKSVVASMRESGGGAIVNIASTSGLAGSPMMWGYVSSKFAVRGLTKVGALELAPMGIRVNAIFPGGIATGMNEAMPGGFDPRIGLAQVPLDRIGTCDDVSGTAVFLASEESRAINGAEFVCDGGWLAGPSPNGDPTRAEE